jgi:hypothetical protein
MSETERQELSDHLDKVREVSDHLVELLEDLEDLRAVAEEAWGKDSPQAQEARDHRLKALSTLESMLKIEKDNSEVH